MKHFEITYFIGKHAFTFECTTAHEAYDAMSDIATNDPKAYIDLDRIIEILVSMKYGNCLSHSTAKYQIRYLDGEV